MAKILFYVCILLIIAGCFGARIAAVAIVEAGGIPAGLAAVVVLFGIGYLARDYL